MRSRGVRSRHLLPAAVALVVVAVLVGTQLLSTSDPRQPARDEAGPVLSLTRLTQDVARTAAGATDLSRGCAVAPRGVGRSSARELLIGERPREFRLHVPSDYVAGRPTPLVVAFHGRHRSGALLEADTGLSGLPVLVAYPEGIRNQVGRLDWQVSPQAAPGVDDLALTRAILADVERRYCVDRDRVYALGHSNGGGMAVAAACAMPRTFAAVVSISGAYYDRAAGCVGRPIALLEIHGTGDGIIPYRGRVLPPSFGRDVRLPRIDRWVRNQAVVNGCAEEPRRDRLDRGVPRVTWARCRSGRPVQHVRIDGGWHRVPTAANLGGRPLAVVVWRFLRGQHQDAAGTQEQDAGTTGTTGTT